MDWKATLRVVILGVMLLGDGKLFFSLVYFTAYIYLICLCETQRWPYEILFWMRYIYITHVSNHCLLLLLLNLGEGVVFDFSDLRKKAENTKGA